MDCSRRQILQYGASLSLLSLSGCTKFENDTDEDTVGLSVINWSDTEQSVEITVESDSETVFEESYDLPAPEGGVGSISENGILEAGQYTVIASNDRVRREYQYRSTCASVDDMDDKIYVFIRGDAPHLEISSTYCGK